MSRLLSAVGTLLLCFAVVAATLWAVQVARSQPALPELAAAPAPDAQQADGQPLQSAARAMRPEVFYAAVLERPVFAPSRRPQSAAPQVEVVAPAPAPAPDPEPQAAPAPQLGLLGVMGNADDSRALVSNDGGDPVWVSSGTTIAGWQISAIGVDWLELTLENETIRIEMYQQ